MKWTTEICKRNKIKVTIIVRNISENVLNSSKFYLKTVDFILRLSIYVLINVVFPHLF